MIMPTTGKRKTTRAQITLLETGRLDLNISTIAHRLAGARLGQRKDTYSTQ